MTDTNEQKKAKLGYHFQRLVNAVEDADLRPEGLEVVELIVAAKKRCWEVINEEPKGAGMGVKVSSVRLVGK